MSFTEYIYNTTYQDPLLNELGSDVVELSGWRDRKIARQGKEINLLKVRIREYIAALAEIKKTLATANATFSTKYAALENQWRKQTATLENQWRQKFSTLEATYKKQIAELKKVNEQLRINAAANPALSIDVHEYNRLKAEEKVYKQKLLAITKEYDTKITELKATIAKGSNTIGVLEKKILDLQTVDVARPEEERKNPYLLYGGLGLGGLLAISMLMKKKSK